MGIYYHPPQPQAPVPHVVQEPIPPPPKSTTWLWAVLASWEPGPPTAQAGKHAPVSVTAVPADNPPFGLRNPLWPILKSWDPRAPDPPRGLPSTVPAIAPAVVNDPPFGLRNPLWPILRAWEPREPDPQRSGWLRATNYVALGHVFTFRPRARTLALLARDRTYSFLRRARVFAPEARR